VPDVAGQNAGAGHLGVEAIAGPEQGECGVGDRQLLVRRRHECERLVARVDDSAGAEVDGERRGPRGVDMRDLQRPLEPQRERRIGRARGSCGDEEEDERGQQWAEAR
jgi:hypothetical protein